MAKIKKEMKIKLSQIKEYELNNKDHPKQQIDLLKKMISEYGYDSPIIVNKDHVIIAGHGRLKALQELGYEEVEVIVKDKLTKKQEQKYRLLDNKITELATSNIDNIKLELEELEDAELNELYPDIKLDEIELDEANEDSVPEPQKEAKLVQVGDMFQLGEHYLKCGDSMNEDDIKDLLKKSHGVKTHCISDPPYGIAYNPDSFGMIKNDDKILDYTELAKRYSDGFFCMRTGYQVVDKWKQLIEKTFDKITNMIIRHKGGGGMGDCARSLAQDYEILLVSNRGNEIQGHRIGSMRYRNKEEKKKFIDKANKTELQESLLNITEGECIWKVGKDNNMSYMHPTQKPVGINDKVILNFTAYGENVLDLFGGSGSNLLSCEKNGRYCYMMELDPVYIEVILKRYHEYTKGNKEIKCLNRDLDLNQILND